MRRSSVHKNSLYRFSFFFTNNFFSLLLEVCHEINNSGMSTRYGFGGLEWNPTDLEGSDGAEVVFVHPP